MEKNEEIERRSSFSSDESFEPEMTEDEASNYMNKDILNEILEDKTLDFLYQQQVEKYINNFREYDSYANKKSENNNSNKERKPKRRLRFRYGDWVCLFCLNYNFSFRNLCNRCQKSKEESEKIYETFEFSLKKI